MFKNYPQPDYYIPNNRRIRLPKDTITIMIGETTVHSFEVPLICKDSSNPNVLSDVTDFKAIYKLGLDVILEKSKDECDILIDEERHSSILTWVLSPSETKLFESALQNPYEDSKIKVKSLLDCQVQLKFEVKEPNDNNCAHYGGTCYSDIMNIKLENSLDEGD